jgi:hypothetical protein
MSTKNVLIYQLKVTLEGCKPPVWRNILVPGNITLQKLHQIIQIVMGWTDSHLHQFEKNGVYFGEPSPDDDFVQEDERKVQLNELLAKPKDWIRYEYDFGDSWEHRIILEKVLEPSPELKVPICLDGKNACPPEDCGGVWGYAGMLEAITNPKHPEHEEFLDWLGEEFDPQAFDLEEVNEVLKNFHRK